MYSAWISYVEHEHTIRKQIALLSVAYIIEDGFASTPKHENEYNQGLKWDSPGGETLKSV